MTSNHVVKYVCDKFNLRDMQARMYYNSQDAWKNLLKDYFMDTEKGKEAIETYIADDEAGNFAL